MQEDTLPFDRIVLTEDSGTREVTLLQFLSLPLHRRIHHIVGRSIQFYSGSRAVERGEALRTLSAWQTAAART